MPKCWFIVLLQNVSITVALLLLVFQKKAKKYLKELKKIGKQIEKFFILYFTQNKKDKSSYIFACILAIASHLFKNHSGILKVFHSPACSYICVWLSFSVLTRALRSASFLQKYLKNLIWSLVMLLFYGIKLWNSSHLNVRAGTYLQVLNIGPVISFHPLHKKKPWNKVLSY